MNKLKSYVSGKYLFFFFVVLSILGVIYFLGSYFLETNPNIKDLKLTNISDTSVTVTYFTDTPSYGSVIISDNDNFNILSGVLKVKYYDDRNDGILRTSHHITINGLKSESVYYLRVMGNLKEVAYTYPTVVTGRTLDSLRTPDPSYGKFLQQTGGSLVNDYILFANLNDSSLQSTFLNIDGAFTLDKTNFRSQDLSSNVTYKNGDQINLQLVDISQTRSVKGMVGEDQPINVPDDIKISSDLNYNISFNRNVISTVLGREAFDFSCGNYPAGANYCNSGNGISYTCVDPTGWKDTGTCSKATPTKETSANTDAEARQQRREEREDKPQVGACSGRSAGAWCGGNDVYDCDGSGGGRVAESCGDRGCHKMDAGVPDKCNDKVATNTTTTTTNSNTGGSGKLNSPNLVTSTCKDGKRILDRAPVSNGSTCTFANITAYQCFNGYDPKQGDRGIDCVRSDSITTLCSSFSGQTVISDYITNSTPCNQNGETKYVCSLGWKLDIISNRCVSASFSQEATLCSSRSMADLSGSNIANSSPCKVYSTDTAIYYQCKSGFSYREGSCVSVTNIDLPLCGAGVTVTSNIPNSYRCKYDNGNTSNYKCNDGYMMSGNSCITIPSQSEPSCSGDVFSVELDNSMKCIETSSGFRRNMCKSGYSFNSTKKTCEQSQSVGITTGPAPLPACSSISDLNSSCTNGKIEGGTECRDDVIPFLYCCPKGQKLKSDKGRLICVSASLNKDIVIPTLAQSVLGTETSSGTSVNVNETGVYNVTSVSGYEITTKEVRVVNVVDGKAEIKFFNDVNSNGVKDTGEEYITTPLEVKLDKQKDLSTYVLTTGWNLISWSITDSNIKTGMDLLNKVANEGGYATHIATYRNGGWVLLSQRAGQKFGKDFDLIPNEGYFVKVLKAVDLNIEGIKISKDQEMFFSTGWNLIGYRSDIKSAKSFIDEVNKTSTLDMDTVTRFENSRYENLVKDSGTFYGNDFNILEDKGYFVRLKKGGVVWKR